MVRLSCTALVLLLFLMGVATPCVKSSLLRNPVVSLLAMPDANLAPGPSLAFQCVDDKSVNWSVLASFQTLFCTASNGNLGLTGRGLGTRQVCATGSYKLYVLCLCLIKGGDHFHQFTGIITPTVK